MSIFILFESVGVLFEGAFSLWVSLKKIKDVVILAADKESCTVTFNKCCYIKKVNDKMEFYVIKFPSI